jgi:hypothetical protein
MPAAACLNPAGSQKESDSEVAHIMKVSRASGVFPDVWPKGCSILEQRTGNDQDRRIQIINHLPVIVQRDIPNEVANWFHAIEDKNQEQVKYHI